MDREMTVFMNELRTAIGSARVPCGYLSTRPSLHFHLDFRRSAHIPGSLTGRVKPIPSVRGCYCVVRGGVERAIKSGISWLLQNNE